MQHTLRRSLRATPIATGISLIGGALSAMPGQTCAVTVGATLLSA